MDWHVALRQHRRNRGLSRAALAARAGVSASSLKAFEHGQRHPKEATLNALIDALGLAREEANPMRLSAGYAVDWFGLLSARYPSEDLAKDIEACPWPVFITNQATDVVHANHAFQRVWDVDLSREFLDPGERNLIANASNPRWVHSIENFDEMVTYLVGLIKGDPRWAQTPENPAPWLQSHLQRFIEGDPAAVQRVLRLWNDAPPLVHRARHMFRVRWRYREKSSLRFLGITTIADLWNELSWNDWLPEDAETWQALAEIIRD
ncbi:MAG TPA: helix-turn-helix transcriptional regulator [Dehalococcoidia bacterium]